MTQVPPSAPGERRESKLKGWLKGGWDKAVIGVVAGAILTVFAWAKGFFGQAIDAASQQGVAAFVAKDPEFLKRVSPLLPPGPIGPVGPQGPPGPPGAAGPIGCVVAWPTAAAVPAGWMICDGAVLNAADYPEIATLLDKTYGAEGPGKVKLPDFRGYFLRGLDDKGRVDPEKRRMGVPQEDAFAAHTHGLTDDEAGIGPEGPPTRMTVGHPASKNQTESTGDSETRPKNYAVHWIIRVK